MPIADIVVIGSGAAATTTLIEAFTRLLAAEIRKDKLHITVIDKHSEFWKGIPYGSRSSINALTITHTADFVSVEKDWKLFSEWLKVSHDEWTNFYRLNGGIAASVWLENNLPLIAESKWNEVYLPRFVFGRYMQSRLLGLLKQVEQKQLAELTLIEAEAISIKQNSETFYEITLEDEDEKISTIEAQKVVIAIGSAPVRNNAETNDASSFTYVNDIYSPSVNENLKLLQSNLQQTSGIDDKNILIIGSNASCIELLYLLNHRPDILIDIHKIVVISRSGKMPYYLSETGDNSYPTFNLDKVKAQGKYDVQALVIATKKDIADAIKQTVVIPHINKIIGYTIELLQPLGDEAKAIFFSVYGPQITKLIRRSGPAYKDASDNLIANGKLELLKGEFLAIEANINGGVLNYTDGNDGRQNYPMTFKVVINCSGSYKLQNSSSRLINSLLSNNICRLTLSGEGISVNEKFEAAPYLYITGPLLAGNMNKIIHFWHLENVSRLLYLAPYLAKQLVNN